MSDATHDGGNAEWLALTEGYCSGTLSSDEFAKLERLLLSDAEARAFFRRYLGLDAALRDYGDNAARNWFSDRQASVAAGRQNAGKPETTQVLAKRGYMWSSLRLASITVAGIVTVATLLTMILNRSRAEASILGTLEQVTGDVRIVAPDGQIRAIDSDVTVKSGDTVSTRGTQSSTVMAYRDGTRLTLVGNTSVTYGDQQSKSIVVHQGTLGASVQPQPRERPMLLATPSAQMQVLGTRFLIEAVANRTDLSVSEGRVRLVRIRDGEAVEVADGKQATVTEQDSLVVEDIPALAATWETDFEKGLPVGWMTGEHVTGELPRGSLGAVKVARIEDSEDGKQYGIVSHDAWVHGLFAAQERSHLHFTFKKGNRGWLNVFLSTRTADPDDPRFAANFLFNEFPWIEPGEWQTASIPLAKFERQHRGNKPLHQLVPVRVVFVSPQPGLVIDRIWVTSDGPGELEVNALE